MNQSFAACCLIFLCTQQTQAHISGLAFSHFAYAHQIGAYIKQAALTAASIATCWGIIYYLLLPAVTQTTSNIGTAVVDQTTLLIEKAAENTTPYAAGAFLIDYGLHVSGLPTRQANSRRYAAAAFLYLLEKKILKR